MGTLLTGATGYLGGYLTHELLSRGERVWALVRASDEHAARERMWRTLQLHLSAPELKERLASGQLRLVRGDVTASGLGLAQQERDQLQQEPLALLHVAASLNRRSAKQCFDVNLRGGLAVLKFARDLQERGLLRRYGHVSTVAVAGKRQGQLVREDEAIEWGRSDWDPYARTKKFAEHMVAELLPEASTLVFRPSIVLGDSRFPQTTQFDMARAFVRLGQLPLLPFDPAVRLDIVPADFVAQAITTLFLAEQPRYPTYHLSAGTSSPTFREITDTLAESLGRRRPRYLPRLSGVCGGAVRGLAQLRWGKASQFASLMHAFWPYLEWDVVFDNSRVTGETGLSPASFPSYCGQLFRFAQESGFRYPYQDIPALLQGSLRSPRRLPVAGRAG